MTEPNPPPSGSGGWQQLFPYQSRELVTGGVRQAYVDEGASGPSVLMVHGNPTWSFYWHRLIADVRQWGRAIAVDHVGCGRSERPVDYRYTLQTHVDNLVSLVERLDLRDLTLVGHDWGGAIGMGCLLRVPDRFRRIVLMNTAAFPPPYFPWRIKVLRTPVLGRLADQGMNLFARAAIGMATNLPGGLPAAEAAGLLAPYDSWSRRRAVHEFVRDIPVRTSQPTWQLLEQIERGLAGLKQEKLLVWGMRDWCFRPVCLERFLRHWPDAGVLRLPEAGHYVMLDAGEAVVEAIRRFVVSGGTPNQTAAVRVGKS